METFLGMNPNLILLINIGMFLLALFSAIGSYYKAIADIRQAINNVKESIREEMKRDFTSKEETKFIHGSLARIESQLTAIFKKLEDKNS